MASNSETGHAKNVANLQTLITYSNGYGAEYNPSNPDITINAMQSMHTSAKASLSLVNKTLAPYSKAVENREIIFAPLNKLITRSVKAFVASKVSKQALDNLKTPARKIKGARAKKKAEPKIDPANPEALAQDTSISVSQMSYDMRVENFEKFIEVLKVEPNYKPNETDLQTAPLEALYADMLVRNKLVKDAAEPLSNARIARNKILYGEVSGLVKTATEAKNYIISVYGVKSPQHKQIMRLAFKIIKDK